MPADDLPRASLIDGIRLTAQVGLPNVVQGVFRRRRLAASVASTAHVDDLAVGFLRGLRRRLGAGPFWIRLGADEVLLLLGGEPARRLLDRSPDPWAADPPPKRRGMVHFQPEALTISRSPQWEPRRRFAEAVLDSSARPPAYAARVATVCLQETDRMLGEGQATVDLDRFGAAVRRMTRRIVLGDEAGPDERLSEMLGRLMDEANGMPGEKPSELREEFYARLETYVEAAASESLVGRIHGAPAVDHPAGQVTHWLFAFGDTLTINALRCIALLAVHRYERARALEELAGADLTDPDAVAGLAWVEACLQEAMRLFPTTPMLSRVTTRDTDWDGVPIREGTQALIVNTFLHRDPETHDYADRFSPEIWLSGDAASDPAFNHFSRGPQGCPGSNLARFAGTATVARVLATREVTLESPGLSPGRLPRALDQFAIRVLARPRG